MTTTWILVHDLGRSGVPIVLDRLLRWHTSLPLDERSLGEVHVIAQHGGPLRSAIAASSASLTILEPASGRSPALTVAVAAAQLGVAPPGREVLARSRRWSTRQLPRPDRVLVHGAGAWSLWEALEGAVGDAPLTLHLHELSVALGRAVPDPAARRRLATRPEAIVAVCPLDEPLRSLLGDRADAVVTVPECVDALADPAPRRAGPEREVLAVGEAGWRKGTDRFVAIAHHVGAARPDLRFRWCGEPLGIGWRGPVDAELPVTWSGPTSDPWADVAAGSVVVVPSREDPLPLVALEAGARGLPVVATATGALPELLAEDRGWCVPGHDLGALAAAVEAALDDEGGRRGERLRAHVAAELVVGVVGPRWLAALT